MSKVLPLAEALRRHVPDGASVALGTALECLIPFAAAHELIRQGRRDLTLVGPISDICFEQLIAAGCVQRVVAAWVGNVQHGAAYAFRRALEHGVPRPLEIEDHSNFSIALALEAAAQGVPYLPTRSLLGSDLLARNPRLRAAPCPFTGCPWSWCRRWRRMSPSSTSSGRMRTGTATRGGRRASARQPGRRAGP